MLGTAIRRAGFHLRNEPVLGGHRALEMTDRVKETVKNCLCVALEAESLVKFGLAAAYGYRLEIILLHALIQGLVFFFVVRNGIQRENVNPQTGFDCALHPGTCSLDESPGGIAYSGVCEIYVGALLGVNYIVARNIESREQAVVVRTRYKNVNIIIPRDETLVPDSPQKRAIGQKISDIVLLAEFVDIFEDIETCIPHIVKRHLSHRYSVTVKIKQRYIKFGNSLVFLYFCRMEDYPNIKQLSLRELQHALLDILVEVDKFCRENRISYSLTYGTLLGAIRHKGFIPWDDDLDIMMPRKDFEHFMALFPQSGSGSRFTTLYNTDTPDSKCILCYGKVEDTTSVCNELKRKYLYKFGINIDIFPIDSAPADPAEHYKFARTVSRLRHRLYLSQRPFFPFTFHDPIIPKIQAHRRSPDEWFHILENYLTQYNGKNTPYSGPVSGGMGTIEIYRNEVFKKYTEVEFEGHSFRAIADWDTFLRQQFGDYMQLPPEDKRKSHAIVAYFKEDTQ